MKQRLTARSAARDHFMLALGLVIEDVQGAHARALEHGARALGANPALCTLPGRPPGGAVHSDGKLRLPLGPED